MYRTRGGNCTIKSETDHTAYITRLRHAPKMVTLIMRNSSRSVGRLSPRRKLQEPSDTPLCLTRRAPALHTDLAYPESVH